MGAHALPTCMCAYGTTHHHPPPPHRTARLRQRDHRGTRSCEVIKLTQEAQDEMAALDHVLALHAELHEQENVLSMFMGQRDEALAAQRAQQDEMASLRAEKA